MKLIGIKTCAILALLSVTGYSFGYQFTLANKTKDPLVVRVKTRGVDGFDKYALIQPNKQETVSFDGLLCLESLSWAQFDPEEKFEGSNSKFKGKNLMEIVEMGGLSDSTLYKNVFAPLAKEYAMHPLQMRMIDNPAHEKEVETAPTSELAKIARLAKLLIEISLCKNRRFIIIDTGEEDVIDIGGRKVKAGHNELIAVTEKGA